MTYVPHRRPPRYVEIDPAHLARRSADARELARRLEAECVLARERDRDRAYRARFLTKYRTSAGLDATAPDKR